jgi:GR25 family glycosyltransferase involved in LPS biosynthesis
MDFFVISLERTPERLSAFMRDNGGLIDFTLVPAVDGENLPFIEPSISDGTSQYSNGAMGCALSHINLWKQVAASGRAATILEDDAVLNENFRAYQERLILSAPPEWDLILWGWNFDSILHVDPQSGVGMTLMSFDQSEMRKGVETFKKSQLDSSLYKLRNAFGTMCYSISKSGAEKMMYRILPLRRDVMYIPGFKGFIKNFGLDSIMNKYYSELSCLVSYPPIAVTHNDKNQSTVSPQRR